MTHLTTLEHEIQKEVKSLKFNFDRVDSLSKFRITIKIHGELHHEHFAIEYVVGITSYDEQRVLGNNLNDCIQEFLRRHKWEKLHRQKLLTGKTENDDKESHL